MLPGTVCCTGMGRGCVVLILRTSPSSPGSEVLTLQQSGLDSTPLDRLNKTLMQSGSSVKDLGDVSLGGETSAIYRQQTLNGELASTARPSSLEGSPASRSVLPGRDEARQMTVTSGRKCLELCGSSGPLGSLERMLLESSVWNSNIAVLTWKVKGIPSGRSLFQLAASVPVTDGNGSSLWPTPLASDTCMGSPNNGKYRIGSNGERWGLKLSESVLLPTPTAPGPHQVGRIEEWGGSGNPFRMLPTPRGRDWKGQTQRGIHAPNDALPNMDKGDGKPIGGMLNPQWVEWLMGFPIGWTDCEVSAMQSCHNKSIRSLRVSHRSNRRR